MLITHRKCCTCQPLGDENNLYYKPVLRLPWWGCILCFGHGTACKMMGLVSIFELLHSVTAVFENTVSVSRLLRKQRSTSKMEIFSNWYIANDLSAGLLQMLLRYIDRYELLTLHLTWPTCKQEGVFLCLPVQKF